MAITDCNIDLVFVVDSSYLLGTAYWQDALNFMVDIVNSLTVGPYNAQIGLVILGNDATVVFHLNTYTTKSSIISAIQSVPYSLQWTNIANGLNVLRTDLFTTSNGDRYDHPNVAVVLVGVEANQGQSATLTSAQSAWTAGINIFSIGTNSASSSEVQAISSFPQFINKNYYLINDSSQLSSLESTLIINMCSIYCSCKALIKLFISFVV